ncbi:low temperature requirement protein A [Lysobacter rhizosphaerae]
MTEPAGHRIVAEGPDSGNLGTEVSPLELFFDVVFVFAVSQLSAHLVHALHWRGLAETLVMLVGVFFVWTYSAFEVTLTHGRPARTRAMLLVVMVLGLFMNAAIDHAFEHGALAFVVPMLVIQIGRTIFSTLPTVPGYLRNHYWRMLGWQVLAAPLWLAGALGNTETRLAWWSAAAGVDLIGTWLAHPVPGTRLQSEHMPFDATHMLERLRLFLIIALGEIVFASGQAIAEAGAGVATLFTGVCAAVIVIAFWALYFTASDPLVSRHTETTSDPLRAARLAANGMVLVVAGLIAVAVANEVTIADPGARTGGVLAVLMFGGALGYLLVQTWYLRLASGHLSWIRMVFMGAMVLSACVAPGLRNDVSLALLAIELVLLAAFVGHAGR